MHSLNDYFPDNIWTTNVSSWCKNFHSSSSLPHKLIVRCLSCQYIILLYCIVLQCTLICFPVAADQEEKSRFWCGIYQCPLSCHQDAVPDSGRDRSPLGAGVPQLATKRAALWWSTGAQQTGDSCQVWGRTSSGMQSSKANHPFCTISPWITRAKPHNDGSFTCAWHALSLYLCVISLSALFTDQPVTVLSNPLCKFMYFNNAIFFRSGDDRMIPLLHHCQLIVQSGQPKTQDML